jgi:hypothetical protein
MDNYLSEKEYEQYLNYLLSEEDEHNFSFPDYSEQSKLIREQNEEYASSLKQDQIAIAATTAATAAASAITATTAIAATDTTAIAATDTTAIAATDTTATSTTSAAVVPSYHGVHCKCQEYAVEQEQQKNQKKYKIVIIHGHICRQLRF